MINYYNVTYINSDLIQPEIENVYKNMIECNTSNGGKLMDVFIEYIKLKYGNPEKYKSSHYESEKEVRIVYDKSKNQVKEWNEWKLGNVDVYAKRSCINTYIPLEFPKSAIKKIVLGLQMEIRKYISELPNFVSEYRVFVQYGELLTTDIM